MCYTHLERVIIIWWHWLFHLPTARPHNHTSDFLLNLSWTRCVGKMGVTVVCILNDGLSCERQQYHHPCIGVVRQVPTHSCAMILWSPATEWKGGYWKRVVPSVRKFITSSPFESERVPCHVSLEVIIPRHGVERGIMEYSPSVRPSVRNLETVFLRKYLS